jgi:hypothetical protein
MATPEHAHAHEVPPKHCVERPSAAESACDAGCQASSCCQIVQERELGGHSVQNVVGDHIPDGDGGCQRSTPDSHLVCCSPTCLDRAQGVFAFDARALAGAYSLTAEDGCPSDCTPSEQACLISSGTNADRKDMVASAADCGCCGCIPKDSARGPTGSIADNENNVATATAEGDCCSGCTLECHPARGPVYPVDTGPAEKEDIVVISTVNTRASI